MSESYYVAIIEMKGIHETTKGVHCIYYFEYLIPVKWMENDTLVKEDYPKYKRYTEWKQQINKYLLGGEDVPKEWNYEEYFRRFGMPE